METPRPPTGCVVVGVDAAQPTDRALDWAADQAALEGRHLLLVHGTGTPLAVGTSWSGVGGPDPLQVFSDLEAAGRALLARATTRVVTRHPELVVHQSVRAVDPCRALLDVSADAALLVVGSRGRGHVLSVVLGSVSEEVADRASCPVVVIRPQHSYEARRGVLVGTDGTAESQAGAPLRLSPRPSARVAADRHALRVGRGRRLPAARRTRRGAVARVGPCQAGRVRGRPGRAAPRGADDPRDRPRHSRRRACSRCADSMDLVVVGHHERGMFGRFTHELVAVDRARARLRRDRRRTGGRGRTLAAARLTPCCKTLATRGRSRLVCRYGPDHCGTGARSGPHPLPPRPRTGRPALPVGHGRVHRAAARPRPRDPLRLRHPAALRARRRPPGLHRRRRRPGLHLRPAPRLRRRPHRRGRQHHPQAAGRRHRPQAAVGRLLVLPRPLHHRLRPRPAALAGREGARRARSPTTPPPSTPPPASSARASRASSCGSSACSTSWS